jgi:hypothetical protein
MAQPFAEVLLTVKEVSMLGRSERRVLLNKDRWGAKADGTGRNGKPVYRFPLHNLPEELQHAYATQSQASSLQSADIESDNIYLGNDARVSTANDSDRASDAAEQKLTAALQRFPLDVREAVLDEARRRLSIVQRYRALPVKRQRVANLDVAGSKPAVRARLTSAPGTSMAETPDAPADAGRGSAKLRATSAGYEFTPAVQALCAETPCPNELLVNYYKDRRHVVRKGSEIAITRAVGPQTLDNWSRRERKEGLLALLPAAGVRTASGSDRVDRRVAALPLEAVDWINRNYKTFAHARALYRAFKKAAHRNGWSVPSERWIYRLWKNIPAVVKAAQHSQKEYVGRFAPYVPRDYRDLEALQILCGDHSVRDVMVRLPDGSLVRPWLTIWQCLRTLLIWGWHLDLVPSSATIGLAYAAGVKTFGAQPIARPADDFYSYLYTDQGKDYRSQNIAGKQLVFKRAAAIDGGLAFLCSSRHVGLVDDLGLKQMLARGYNAREKPVERTHRVLSDWEQNTFAGMYCGRDAKNKPDEWKAAFARHDRLLKKASGGNSMLLDDSPFMTIDDYRDALTGRIAEYNQTGHQRATLGGAVIVPIEEHERLYTTRYTVSEESLALLLLKSAKRRVVKNGVRMFQQGWHYLCPELSRYKGDDFEVEVRYSESDYSHVFIVPPSTPDIPNPKILRADLVTPTSIQRQHLNKQTVDLVARTKNHERKLHREWNLLTQSIIRGESTEERVAAQLEPEEEIVEAVAAAAGGSRTPVSSRGPMTSISAGVPDGFHIPARMSGDGGYGAVPSSPATVHQLTRLDRVRVTSPRTPRPVTVDEVASVAVDESIFADDDAEFCSSGNLVRMFEDEEE